MAVRGPGDVAAWEALFAALDRDREALLAQIHARIADELPSYRLLPQEQLDRDVRIAVERTLASARAGRRAIGDRELAELAQVGAEQARHGVPVQDMLRVWRLGIELVVDHARAVSSSLGVSDAALLEFVQALLAWSDAGMVASAGAHRDAEIEIARQDHDRRAAFTRDVLLGTLAPAGLPTDADAYGLDTTVEYVAVRARPAPGTAPHELERALRFHDAGPPRRGLSTQIDGDVCGLLREAPSGDLDGVAGVGPPARIERLAESFRLATRALATAGAFGLRGVHDLGSLGVRPAVAADRDVSDALTRRYLEPLAATASGAEIVATLRAYLACGMHVERAAKQLFVHPNTLRYRIARFEELTGSSLRDVTVVSETWWALEAAGMRSEVTGGHPR